MAEVRSIAVIGAAALGRGIAQLAAIAGFHTILEDILPASLRNAESDIRRALDGEVARAAITRSAADAALARIEFASSVEQAGRAAELIIEAVPDELESKLEILTLLDKVCRPASMLACTSSIWSVTELASVTYRPAKIVGLRFALPANGSDLLEMVRGQNTDDTTIAACREAGRRMGRKVVVIEDSPRTVAD